MPYAWPEPTQPLILVTRMGLDGERLCRRLKAMDRQVLHLPLQRFEGPVDPALVRSQLSDLDSADGLIMTSREGVRRACDVLEDPFWFDLPLVVPGAGTAALARDCGFSRVECPSHGGDSEAMLSLDRLRQVKDQRWLVLAAPGGRRLLDETLARRGALVTRLDIYRRIDQALEPASLGALVRAPSLLILIASGSALQRLAEALPQPLWMRVQASPMVVPAERLRREARALGCQHVFLSAGADDRSMLEVLDVLPGLP